MPAAIARAAVGRMRTDSTLGARVGREGMIAACSEGARRLGSGHGDGHGRGIGQAAHRHGDGAGGHAPRAAHSDLAAAPGTPGTVLDAPRALGSGLRQGSARASAAVAPSQGPNYGPAAAPHGDPGGEKQPLWYRAPRWRWRWRSIHLRRHARMCGWRWKSRASAAIRASGRFGRQTGASRAAAGA